jgi:hypothetical protein
LTVTCQIEMVFESRFQYKLFHLTALSSQIRKKIDIFSLVIDGTLEFNQHKIKKHVTNDYIALLGTFTRKAITFDASFWRKLEKLFLHVTLLRHLTLMDYF